MAEMQIQEKTLEESEAIIKSNENFVGMGLWNIGNEFKYIRDKKTYLQKGYSGFSEYIEAELKYERSQAYNFITIAEKYSVQSIGQVAHLGIVKMLELSKFEEPQRQEFISTTPIDDMTTRELQKAIKEKKEADQRIQDLEQQLQSKPKEVEVVRELEIVIPPPDYQKLKNDLELAELEKQQLQRRIKEETNPELFQQMAKRESEARVEVHQLKKQLESMEADSKTIEHKVKIEAINFCARVHNFLESVGGMVWITDYADLFDEKEKQGYLKAINAVEAWAQNLRNNFKENE